MNTTLKSLFFALTIWSAISTAIFRIRHPWATETEVAVYFIEVITLQKVSYEESRSNYE